MAKGLLLLIVAFSTSGLSAEVPIAEPELVPHRYSQEAGSIATDGTNFLVVWENWFSAYAQTTDLSIARVNSEGELIDAPAIPLGTGVSPDVVWNGAEYILAYNMAGSRFGTLVPIPNLVIARVSRDGQLLERRVLVSSHCTYASGASIGWNGSNYVVAWGGCGMQRILLDSSLEVVAAPSAVPLSGSPRVTALGGGFVIASSSGQVVMVSTTGELSSPFEIESLALDVALAQKDEATLAAILRQDAIEGRFILPNGALGPTFPIATSRFATEIQVTSLPDGYLIAWTEADEQYGQTDVVMIRVDSGGRTLAPAKRSPLVDRQSNLRLASIRGDVLVVWSHYPRGMGADLFGTVVPGGNPSRFDPNQATILALQRASQLAPRIAPNPAGSLVVWTEGNDVTNVLLAIRLDPSGRAIDAEPLQLGVAERATRVSIAFNGSEYLVVWSSRHGLKGQLVSADRKLLGSEIQIDDDVATLYSVPDVVAVGQNFFVVWEKHSTIFGARITAGGFVVHPNGLRLQPAQFPASPALAWNGEELFIVWQFGAIIGARYTPDATPIGAPVALSPQGRHANPTVAWNGTHYLVAWQTDRSSCCAEYEIRGARLTRDLSPLDGTPSTNGFSINNTLVSESPRVQAFPDGRFAVAWKEDPTLRMRTINPNDLTMSEALFVAPTSFLDFDFLISGSLTRFVYSRSMRSGEVDVVSKTIAGRRRGASR